MRRPTRNTVLVGGGIFTLVAGLAAGGATLARKRYITGTAKVKQLVNLDEGVLVVLDDDQVFCAPSEIRTALDTYTGDTAGPLPYKIDRFRRSRSGLLTGSVNIDI